MIGCMLYAIGFKHKAYSLTHLKILHKKKSLIVLMKLFERETGFTSAALSINFSPLSLERFKFYTKKKKPHRYDEAFERETGFEPATFSLEG